MAKKKIYVGKNTRKTKKGRTNVETPANARVKTPSNLKKREKFYKKLTHNPRNIGYDDLKTAVEQFGFKSVRQKGSHHMFKRKVGNRTLFMNLQPDKKDKARAKTYQVKEFINMIDDNKLLENE